MPKQTRYLLIFLIQLSVIFTSAQPGLYLVKKNNPKHKKALDLERDYEIKTGETLYFSKIISYSDSSLFIKEFVNTLRDTTIYFYSKHDTTEITRPIKVVDTLEISFSRVETIKKDVFKKRGWLAVPAMFGIGAALGIVGLPYALIKGGETLDDYMVFEGVLLGLSLPPILIGNATVKYDTKRKWLLKTEGGN